MRHAEFLAYSRRMAEEEAARPERFRARLWRWIAAAHLAIALPSLVTFGAVAVLLWAFHGTHRDVSGGFILGLLVLILLGIISLDLPLKLLQIRRPIPPGLELSRAESPELFRELDTLCAQMEVPPFDGVLLAAACNAYVTKGPRPGHRGHRRYLALGVPLLQAMSADEMRAVLAHELSHRGDYRGLITAVARVQRWLSLVDPGNGNPRRSAGMHFIDVPAAWFAPRFRAMAFVLSRRTELRADAAAAKLTGVAPLAFALVRLPLIDSLFGEWVESIWRCALKETHAPGDLPARWDAAVRQCDLEKLQAPLTRALREVPGPASTHPSLTERLASIGAPTPAEPPARVENTAWDTWLTDSREAVARKFATWWAAAMAGSWTPRRQALLLADALSRQEAPTDVPQIELEKWLWDRATAASDLEGHEAARPWVEKLLALRPTNEDATDWMIRDRLRNDDEGVLALLRAQPPNQGLEQLWLEAAALFARRREPDREAECCVEAERAADAAVAMIQELNSIQPGDILRPHSLAPEHAAILVERASVLPPVIELYAVRKELTSKPDESLHLIGIRLSSGQAAYRGGCINEISQALQAARVPGYWRIVIAGGLGATLNSAVFRAPGALLYSRENATR